LVTLCNLFTRLGSVYKPKNY